MLGGGQHSKFRIISRTYGLAVGFIVLVLWVTVLAVSLILYVLGFKVPEMLISSEASMSAVGYCWLLNEFYIPRRRGEKHYRLLTFLELSVGVILIITGVYNIVLANLNVFTYLCLIIGTALIFINAKI
jgi:Flp pilus assembly protein TadB